MEINYELIAAIAIFISLIYSFSYNQAIWKEMICIIQFVIYLFFLCLGERERQLFIKLLSPNMPTLYIFRLYKSLY